MAPKRKPAVASTAATTKSVQATTRAKRAETDSEPKLPSKRAKKDPQTVETSTDAAEPPKRRGRPAKESTTEPSTTQKPKSTRGKPKTAEPVETEPEAATEPKKRGRSAKAAPAKPDATEVPIPATKPSRGRKAAVKAADELQAVVEEVTSKTDELPKSRARASKASTAKKSIETSAKSSTRGKAMKTSEPVPEPAPSTARGKRTASKASESVSQQEAPKRGRGRAKETTLDVVEEPASKRGRGKAKVSTIQEDPEELAPKRGRGKTKVSTIQEDTEELAPKRGRAKAKKEEPSESDVPKGRRRKAAEQPVPADPEPSKPVAKKRSRAAVAIVEENDSVEPAPKQKRGRSAKTEQIAEPAQIEATTKPSKSKKTRGEPSKTENVTIESEQPESTRLETQAVISDSHEELMLQADAMDDVVPKKKSRVSKAGTEILEHTPKRELTGSTPASAPARAETAQETPGTVIRKPSRQPKSTPIASRPNTPKSGLPQKSDVLNAISDPAAVAESARLGNGRSAKRRPSTDAGELDEAPAAKRVRRESATADADKTTPKFLPAASKPNRRQTISAKAALKTPRSSKTVPVPGTAPAKAASRPGRKRKVSLAELSDAQAEENETANPASMISEIQVESSTTITESVVVAGVSETKKAMATPKARKSSLKPPKTAPANGLLKDGKTAKRSRVSSPGPAPRQIKKVRIEDASLPIINSGPSFWLMKAEPESRIEKGKDVKFSIDDLMKVTEPEPWTGVRNYGARNNMMNMKMGELGFFYHSNTKVPGVVGILEVVREYTVDESAFDENDPYYDEKSSREKPKWFHVHVGFKQKFDHPERTSLPELRKHGENGGPLANMQLLRQGRLSVTKVSKEEWNYILDLAGYSEYKAEIEEPENSMVESTVLSMDASIVPQLEQEVDESAKFLNEVVEDVAAQVAGQVVEELDEGKIPASEEMLEELTDAMADHITDQLADVIEYGTNDVQNVITSTKAVADVNFVVESIIPTTEDLSELPDAPDESSMLLPVADESLDQIGELPSDAAIRQSSPVKRVASRRSSRAPSLPRSRRSSRAPSLPAAGVTPAASKGFGFLVPPATVPAKVADRQVRVDAGPESDPAFLQDTDEPVVDDSFLPGDDSLVDDTFAEVHINANGHIIDDGSGRVGRTYGGDFEYGDSSMIEL